MRLPFRKDKPAVVETYHDHTWSTWGHAVMVQPADENGDREACIFQGVRPSKGDVMLMRSTTRDPDTGLPGVLQYRVVSDVRTPLDPGDQHFMTLRFMEAETNAAKGKDPRSALQRSWDVHGDLP